MVSLQKKIQVLAIAFVSLSAPLVLMSTRDPNDRVARTGEKTEEVDPINYVEIEIELSQGVGTFFDFPLVKDSSRPRSCSFESKVNDEQSYLVTIACDYSSYLRLNHPFDATVLSDGHLIVFWIINSDVYTMKAKSSEVVYGLFEGVETVVFDDGNVKITLRPSLARNTMRQ